MAFTEAQRNVHQLIVEGGRSRKEKQGRRFNQADYFAGAMRALLAVGWEMIDFPVSWTLGIMVGRGPLDKHPED